MSEPVVVEDVIVRPAVVVEDVQVGSPVTLNATQGRAGLWTGEGPPTDVPGAVPGDEYLDTLTGTLYRLGA